MAYQYRPLVGENYRYKTDSEKPFKISRSKIELFYNCQRCFFKQVKLGLREPVSYTHLTLPPILLV